jgi:ABC-type phosphate transport system substrate-binding protein
MDASSNKILSSGAARLAAAAFVVTGFCAAVAAAPALGPLSAAKPAAIQRAAFGDGATALRPFGQGAAIRVNKAYGAEDEDCVLSVTKVEDAQGRVSVTRGVSCAQ